jgi:hypothetical protein
MLTTPQPLDAAWAVVFCLIALSYLYPQPELSPQSRHV